MRSGLDREGLRAWQALVEEPLGVVIEELLADDLVRGLVFTDGKIGVSTHPHDPTLLQNRSFLYHVIGGGTGEWRVPVGGMGALVDELQMRMISQVVDDVLVVGGKVEVASTTHPSRIVEPVKIRDFRRVGRAWLAHPKPNPPPTLDHRIGAHAGAGWDA